MPAQVVELGTQMQVQRHASFQRAKVSQKLLRQSLVCLELRGRTNVIEVG